ncbi:hypothetical protein HDU76_000597 [Blyttiomyces sp. JEL0837]|nr:hypothetical protein HDU76_000597 [Blyttiomyces sp. JEL0837]
MTVPLPHVSPIGTPATVPATHHQYQQPSNLHLTYAVPAPSTTTPVSFPLFNVAPFPVPMHQAQFQQPAVNSQLAPANSSASHQPLTTFQPINTTPTAVPLIHPAPSIAPITGAVANSGAVSSQQSQISSISHPGVPMQTPVLNTQQQIQSRAVLQPAAVPQPIPTPTVLQPVNTVCFGSVVPPYQIQPQPAVSHPAAVPHALPAALQHGSTGVSGPMNSGQQARSKPTAPLPTAKRPPRLSKLAPAAFKIMQKSQPVYPAINPGAASSQQPSVTYKQGGSSQPSVEQPQTPLPNIGLSRNFTSTADPSFSVASNQTVDFLPNLTKLAKVGKPEEDYSIIPITTPKFATGKWGSKFTPMCKFLTEAMQQIGVTVDPKTAVLNEGFQMHGLYSLNTDKTMAAILFCILEGFVYVEGLTVLSDFRRAKGGTTMIDWMKQIAIVRKKRAVVIRCPPNADAERFFLFNGFYYPSPAAEASSSNQGRIMVWTPPAQT